MGQRNSRRAKAKRLKGPHSSGRDAPRAGFIAIGRILAPWGAMGEVKIQVMTDFPQRFRPGEKVYLVGDLLTIERSRWLGEAVVLKLAGYGDRNAVENLRDCYLEIPQEEVYSLPEGQYYQFQIVGLEVRSTQGEALGKIVDVFPTGSNEVFVVRGARGELLFPAIEDVVKEVDLEKGFVVVEALEGLL